MKSYFLFLIVSLFFLFTIAKICAADIPKFQGNEKITPQDNPLTATLKQATRLFEFKDDLTSVIVVLPAGKTVTVIGSDEDYYRVKYENTEGYILKKHAEIDLTLSKKPEVRRQENVMQEDVRSRATEPEREMTRFEHLEKKYGTRLASQISAGKIWKGMTSQMVLDSWGQPQKINRSIGGNYTREEWIYKNTWLFIENNTLIEWGPIRR